MNSKADILKCNPFTLFFNDLKLESDFIASYDSSVRLPLRQGILISLLSWYSGLGLVFYVIPEKASWLVPLTLIYIGSYFGFLIYSTYSKSYTGHYHVLGAISNAWAGMYAIYFCGQFPNGVHFMLPVLIFIMFFGLYMIRLRWMAGFLAASSYTIYFQVYLLTNPNIPSGQIAFYSFVVWMVLSFILLAGRMVEKNNRIYYIQSRTINEQNRIIEADKQFLLKEVHHRVKNNLQVILSLINMQLRNTNGENTQLELKDVRLRVLSMSTVHQWVNQKTNFSMINLSSLVQGLVKNVESFYEAHESTAKLYIPESINLDIERSISFGLIMNELFLLNLKCSEKNHLCFNLEITEQDNSLQISFEDNLGTPFSHSKFGMELIDSLTDQLEANLSISHDQGNRIIFTLEHEEQVKEKDLILN